MLTSGTWGTMFVIRGNSPVNIDLKIVGNCTIQSLGWAPIYSQNDAKVKIVINETNGSLDLQNLYTWDNLINGTRIHVENQNGDVINSSGQAVQVPEESLRLKSKATCEENEIWTYTCPVCGEEEEREKEGTAIGHNYEAKYNWKEDGKMCKLDLICKNDNTHIINDIEMEISEEILRKPTCIEKGITKYIATTTIDGVEYHDSIEKIDIEEIEQHNYVNGICSVCGKQDPLGNKEENNTSTDNDNNEKEEVEIKEEQIEKEEVIDENIDNPKTSDNIYVYVSILIFSFIGLGITFKMKTNKK